MNSILQNAPFLVLASLAFGAIGSLVSSLVVRFLGGRITQWEPHSRHLALGLLAALPVVHVPGVRRWVVCEHQIAAEQACDEAAARVTERLAVATAILAVERVAQQAALLTCTPVGLAFGACAVERGISALLVESAPRPSVWPPALGIVAAIALLLVFAQEVHHLTESALAVLTH